MSIAPPEAMINKLRRVTNTIATVLQRDSNWVKIDRVKPCGGYRKGTSTFLKLDLVSVNLN